MKGTEFGLSLFIMITLGCSLKAHHQLTLTSLSNVSIWILYIIKIDDDLTWEEQVYELCALTTFINEQYGDN